MIRFVHKLQPSLAVAAGVLLPLAIVFWLLGVWHQVPNGFQGQTMAEPRYIETGWLIALGAVLCAIGSAVTWLYLDNHQTELRAMKEKNNTSQA
jgi:hypothetical protein